MKSASKTGVAKKLGIKSGDRIAILYSPRGYTAILAHLPSHVSVTTRLAGEAFDVVQGFYEDERSLKADIRKIRRSLESWGKAWICWRKGNVTRLNRDLIMELGQRVALVSVGSCAIDDEWSGLKFMLPKHKRKNRSVKT